MQFKYIQIISLAVVFSLQFLFEHLFPQRREINNWKHERFNAGIGLLNLVLTFIPATFFVQWVKFLAEKHLGLLHQFSIPLWVQLVITLLVMDAWMYFWHRFTHRVSFLWRFHSFHHKDTRMNTTTALRFHTVELYLSYPGKAFIVLLFGISYLPLLIYEIAFFSAVVIHHSNIRITEKADAVYRSLFASPLMHRIHHSVQFDETNSNFGSLFSFWDRLFKTWNGKAKEEVVFGIPKSMAPKKK